MALRFWQQGLLISILLCTTEANAAAYVDTSGIEWRQLTETRGFSWNEIATVCPAGGGECTGMLDTVDFTGWTWATIDQVGDLFYRETGGYHPGGVADVYQTESDWAPEFLSKMAKTWSGSGYEYAYGLSANLAPNGRAMAGVIYDRYPPNSVTDDQASTEYERFTYTATSGQGAWLFRGAEVPLPAASSLFLAALAGLLGTKRLAQRK